MSETNTNRQILWTGDNWPAVFDFLHQRDFDLVSYALSPDNVLNFTTSTGRFTVPVGEVVKFYPRPATRSSCPTCGGSMHDPCPYREEAEKQTHAEGSSYNPTNDRAHRLRLADENAALQQRVASCKAFHASLCRRFGYGHDDTDWMRDFVSLEEHIASSLTHYGERVREKAAKIGDKHWSFTVGVEIRSMSLPPLNEEGVK